MTYADYPESAKNNAKKALRHKRENGSSCGTRVGWFRAQQLSSGEGLTEDEIRRTYSFLSRAEVYDDGKYFDEDDNEICGSIMYDAWGGKSMLPWAESKFNKLKKEKEKEKAMAYKIDISGEISDYNNSIAYFQSKIKEANNEPLNIDITSAGGSVTEGLGIADIIANYPQETTATGIGLVASIATVVLLAADKVKMTENSFMMIHRPWGNAVGNSEELEATAELLDKMEEQLLNVYEKAVLKRKDAEAGMRKKIKKMMYAETWLTANEALEFGFIDEIVLGGEKNKPLLPLQSILNKFQNVPAALLVNKENDEIMGNAILEKIKSLLNATETVEQVNEVEQVEAVIEVDKVQEAIDLLAANGYVVSNVEANISEPAIEDKSKEIEQVLETLTAELVALRSQVKKGIGLPSGGTKSEIVKETKARATHFDGFANLVKSKISQR